MMEIGRSCSRPLLSSLSWWNSDYLSNSETECGRHVEEEEDDDDKDLSHDDVENDAKHFFHSHLLT